MKSEKGRSPRRLPHRVSPLVTIVSLRSRKSRARAWYGGDSDPSLAQVAFAVSALTGLRDDEPREPVRVLRALIDSFCDVLWGNADESHASSTQARE